MRVKVIIHDCIVVDVLATSQVDLEVVDIDRDYEDYAALIRYTEDSGRTRSSEAGTTRSRTSTHNSEENGPGIALSPQQYDAAPGDSFIPRPDF